MATLETPEMESWRNVTRSKIYVNKLDRRGEFKAERIGPGQTINLTPMERQLNQDKVVEKSLDVFTNGRLEPVRLVDGEEDNEAILSNPNILSDEEMVELFKDKRNWRRFDERLSQIENPVTIRRMLDYATDQDHVTNRQIDAVKDRLRAVAPSVFSAWQLDQEARLNAEDDNRVNELVHFD